MDQVRIILSRGSNDASDGDPQFQEEVKHFSESLRAAGIDFSQRSRVYRADGGPSFLLPHFAVALAPAIIGALAALCGAWVRARYGRKVRLKIGDVEAEGRSVEEIEELLQKAKEYQEDKPSEWHDF
jgi:hypothetical protein